MKSKSEITADAPVVLEAGHLYHVYGWNYKAQFKLLTWDIIEDWAFIVTPKTGKRYYVPASKLFYAKKTKRKLSQRLNKTEADDGVEKNAKGEDLLMEGRNHGDSE